MLYKLKTCTLLLAAFSYFGVNAQDCNCTIDQVMTNTVAPCDFTTGIVDTVYTTNELWDAIRFVNANNGNRTILIADGTYPIASTSSYPYITADNVVFRSLSGNRDDVILTGQGMLDVAPLTENGIFAVGDNIVIANLTIRDVGNHAIAVTGDNLYVYNVKIQNTFEQMIKGNNDGDGSGNSTVKCSYFEYTAGIGPQWYIGGLDIHTGHDWTVSDNIFLNISSPSQSTAEHAIHFWDGSADNLIERNHIINCDRGIGFGLGSSPNDGGIIRNNMIYNDGSKIFHDVGIGLETSPRTKIYNNTIYIAYQNAIEYRFSETFDVQIINNLCNRRITSRNGAAAMLSKNLTSAADIWFKDLSKGDLRLADAILNVADVGDDIPELIDDIDQTNRPQSSQVDIGAHEFSLSTQVQENGKAIMTTVLPNPFTDEFKIELDDQHEGQYEVIIYSNLLQPIAQGYLSKDEPLHLKSLSWPVGIYHCLLTEKGNSSAQQWIKVIKSKN